MDSQGQELDCSLREAREEGLQLTAPHAMADSYERLGHLLSEVIYYV